jgi:hypothetical protein
MIEITRGEATADRETITKTGHLLFSSKVKEKSRLKWRISEINSRNSMIPRSWEHSDYFQSSIRNLIGSKGTEINQIT